MIADIVAEFERFSNLAAWIGALSGIVGTVILGGWRAWIAHQEWNQRFIGTKYRDIDDDGHWILEYLRYKDQSDHNNWISRSAITESYLAKLNYPRERGDHIARLRGALAALRHAKCIEYSSDVPGVILPMPAADWVRLQYFGYEAFDYRIQHKRWRFWDKPPF